MRRVVKGKKHILEVEKRVKGIEYIKKRVAAEGATTTTQEHPETPEKTLDSLP